MNDAIRTVGINLSNSTAYENTRQVLLAQGRVHILRALADPTLSGDRYIQIHDTVTALAGGEACAWEILLPPGSPDGTAASEAFEHFDVIGGFRCAVGITLAVSTVPFIYTPPGQPDVALLCAYEGRVP